MGEEGGGLTINDATLQGRLNATTGETVKLAYAGKLTVKQLVTVDQLDQSLELMPLNGGHGSRARWKCRGGAFGDSLMKVCGCVVGKTSVAGKKRDGPGCLLQKFKKTKKERRGTDSNGKKNHGRDYTRQERQGSWFVVRAYKAGESAWGSYSRSSKVRAR